MRRVACLLFLVLGACEQARTGPEASLERDSADVAIVEASPPYARWSLSPTATVRIGVVTGDPEYQLSDVAHAARLSDGGIVLVDGGSSEVRWYDGEGDFRSRAGGSGEGPGELLDVASAALTPGDTLVLYDSRNQRLSWFAPDGTFSRDRRLELGAGSSIGLHPLEEGRLLVTEERLHLNIGGDEYNPARDSLLVLLASGAVESVDTTMRLPGREATTWVDRVDGRPVGTRQMKLPLGQVTLAGGTANRIAVVGSGQSQLALFDEGGTLVRIARRTDVDPLETSLLRQEYVADRVEWAGEVGLPTAQAEAAAEELLGLLPEGRTVPPFDRLVTDAVDERIWLRDFLPEWESDRARDWTVHDVTGRVVAQVTTPPGFELKHVGGDHLVGVERDEMGVEYVVAYALN